MTPLCLQARGLGVAYGEKPVLASLDFEIPARAVTVLFGPAGTGKSTLLRTLAQRNQSNPRFVQWGRCSTTARHGGLSTTPAWCSSTPG